MPTVFNADEILKIAEQIERNGASYYRRAAESSSDEEVRKYLLDLAVWEEGHEKVFSGLRKQLGEEGAKTEPFDPDDEMTRHLKVMADVLVFDVKPYSPAHLTGEETFKEVIEKALLLEKDSIAYYIAIKEAVPESLGRDKIDAIIKEEMGHVSSLNERLASLREA